VFFVGTARLICTYQHNTNVMNTAYRCSLLTAMAQSRMIGRYPWMLLFRNTHTHTQSLLSPSKNASAGDELSGSTHTPTSDESNFPISD